MPYMIAALVWLLTVSVAVAQQAPLMRPGVPPVLTPDGDDALTAAQDVEARFGRWNARENEPGLIVAWEPFVDHSIPERLKSGFISTLIEAGAHIEDAGEGISFVFDQADEPMDPDRYGEITPGAGLTFRSDRLELPPQLRRPGVAELPLNDPRIIQDPTGFVDPATPDYQAPTVYDYAAGPAGYVGDPTANVPRFAPSAYWIFISAIEAGTGVTRPVYRIRISRTDNGRRLADFTTTGRPQAREIAAYRPSSEGFVEDTRPRQAPLPEEIGGQLALHVMAALAK